MKKYKLSALAALLLLFSLTPLCAKEYGLEKYGYYINLPETWEVLDASRSDFIAFTDGGHTAVFQIHTLTGEGLSLEDAFSATMDKLKAEQDSAPFTYNGRKSIFADVTFKMGGALKVRGYSIFVDNGDSVTGLMAYAPLDSYDAFHDLLLSCLDGVSIGKGNKLLPGPVSQFYYPFPPPDTRPYKISFDNTFITVPFDIKGVDANQVVIEREARILAGFKTPETDPWTRYYRMVYRDAYARLAPLYRKVKEVFEEKGVEDPAAIATSLLKWLQGFQYTRTGTLSDLESPLASVMEEKGDCDSLGILYIALLDYFGIDSILLVSSEYGHSLVALDLPGKGARFPYKNKGYLVAELTDQVAMGLIPRDMADPSKWTPMELRPR